jgi:Phage tail protein.
MITKVETRNSIGELLSLTLDDVTDGYIVEDIGGLGPVKASISSSPYAKRPGAKFQSSRRESRNILFKVGLEPDYSIDTVFSLRQKLYDYFLTESQVFMKFYLGDGSIWDIDGIVESCDPDIFTKEPRVNISVICHEPDFIDITDEEVTGDTTSTSTETLISYPGNVKTGFVFVLNVDRTLTDFTIYMRGPDDAIRSLDFSADLEAGDVLTINTVEGSKGITLVRSGTTSSLLYGKPDESPWLDLAKGNNYIRVYATGDPIPWELTYNARYGGV